MGSKLKCQVMLGGVLAVVVLAGCGALSAADAGVDGGVSVGLLDAGAPGELVVTDAGITDILRVVHELRSVVESASSLSREERLAAAVAYMTAEPAFESSGQTDSSAWGLLRSGLSIVVFDDLLPELDPDAGIPPPLPQPPPNTDVPLSEHVRLVHTLGNAFADIRPVLLPLLQSQNYSVKFDPGTVESLRGGEDWGVLHYHGHGGVVRIPVLDATTGRFQRQPDGGLVGETAYGIQTSTLVDEENLSGYREDINAGRLGVAIALDGYDRSKKEVYTERYYINQAFVKNYLSNHWPTSLVWISGCSASSAAAASFMQAFDSPSVMYIGWTNPKAGYDADIFTFERMLGYNPQFVARESVPQRAFNIEAVWDDLARHGLDTQQTEYGSAKLTYTLLGQTERPFGMLAPSISYVLIDEVNDEAILVGLFPTDVIQDLANQKVTIGGVEASIVKWDTDRVRVKLPRAGAGSSGDVQAAFRDHLSNVRRITEWNFESNYTWRLLSIDPLKVAGPIHLRFRADVGEYRKEPGRPPVHPTRYAIAARDSQALLTGSGQLAQGDCVLSYSGSATLMPSGYDTTSNPFITAMARFDTDARTMAITLILGGSPEFPWLWNQACPDQSLPPQHFPVAFGLMEGNLTYGSPLDDASVGQFPSLMVPVTDQWAILGRTYEEVESDLSMKFQWNASDAHSPPDPQAAR